MKRILFALVSIALLATLSSSQVTNPSGGGAVTCATCATEATQLQVLTAVTDTTPVSVYLTGASSGGNTPYSFITDNSTTSYSVKSTPGVMMKIDITNTLAAAMYVRAYNTSAAPTCTSATGIVMRWIIPASATGAGGSFSYPVGVEFNTGIGLCVTTTVSDTNNTAVASSAAVVNVAYD